MTHPDLLADPVEVRITEAAAVREYAWTALRLHDEYRAEGNRIGAEAALQVANERVGRLSQDELPEPHTARQGRRHGDSMLKAVMAGITTLERAQRGDPLPRSPRMSRASHERLEHYYLNIAGLIANTTELRERLQEGRKQRPKAQKDAFAYHGRRNVEILRATSEVVRRGPPAGALNGRADRERQTRALEEAAALVRDFENWDRRRFPALRGAPRPDLPAGGHRSAH